MTKGRHQIRPASGIYGMIVTGAVLATAGDSLYTAPLIAAVVGSLVVYWLADEYAQLGERASRGTLPTWSSVGAALAARWPMVSASYIPLAALACARVLGATPANAATVALAVAVVILAFYGWSAGRASDLDGVALGAMTAAAGGLGLLMIFLKFAITHLH